MPNNFQSLLEEIEKAWKHFLEENEITFEWNSDKELVESFLRQSIERARSETLKEVGEKVEKIDSSTKFGSIYFTPSKIGEIKKYFLALLDKEIELGMSVCPICGSELIDYDDHIEYGGEGPNEGQYHYRMCLNEHCANYGKS